jgi:hypothetical protein
MSKAKALGFRLASSGLTLLLCLLVAEVVLRILPVASSPRTIEVNAANPVMRFPPNLSFTYSRGWKLHSVNRVQTNNFGWISDQPYDPTARSPLLAVIGDSYVEALMVPFAETLHGRMAKDVGPAGRVYSFGISGAPLSQYLVEAEYAASVFHPAGMAIVVVGNDFDESLLSYKVTPGQHSFVESPDGVLRLTRTDVAPRRLGTLVRLSALARYLVLNGAVADAYQNLRVRGPATREFVGNTAAATGPKRLADSKRVADAFLKELPGRSRLAPHAIVFVVDALRPSIYVQGGANQGGRSYFALMRDYFMAEATRRDFEVLDMNPPFVARFARDHVRFEEPYDGHWNSQGHEEAAKAIERSAVFGSIFPTAQLR